MATLALQPVRLYKARDGHGQEHEELTIVADLIEGELLVKANNAVAAIADSATVITHIMPTISANVMPGKTLKMPLGLLRPGDVYEMSVWHTTAASAVVADSILDAQGDYPVVKKTVSGATAWCLDVANIGSSASVRLVARLSTATDLYPRVLVQFLDTVTQATG